MTYALFHENQNPRIAGRRHAGASEHGLAALGLWIPAIPAGMTMAMTCFMVGSW
jgi:hypothetical protein